LPPSEAAAAVEVLALEDRSLLSSASAITITESVNPQMLAAAGRRPIPVQVSGTVTDTDTAATITPSLAYTVFDTQTNHLIRSGTGTLAGDGTYMFNISLHGRGFGGNHSSPSQFTISVMASDSDGNSGTGSAIVTVTENGHGRAGGNSAADQGAAWDGSARARGLAALDRLTSLSAAQGRDSRTAPPPVAIATP
jgi:hypothetical protein